MMHTLETWSAMYDITSDDVIVTDPDEIAYVIANSPPPMIPGMYESMALIRRSTGGYSFVAPPPESSDG